MEITDSLLYQLALVEHARFDFERWCKAIGKSPRSLEALREFTVLKETFGYAERKLGFDAFQVEMRRRAPRIVSMVKAIGRVMAS